MRTVLSIAGSDPTGGAGLQGDLQVFRNFGLHGAAVPTALTRQNSRAVHAVSPVFPSLVLDQIRELLDDFQPAAVKIGMLATDDIVRNVSLALERLEARVPVVIDPVLAASDGTPLLERRAWPALCELARDRALITPNLPEAELLTGCDPFSRSGAEKAARNLLGELGVHAVLLKGGHAENECADLLAQNVRDGIELHWFEGRREPGAPVHGTGCAVESPVCAITILTWQRRIRDHVVG